MDVVLLTLTTLSLGAAAGFGFLSWRVGREEREREQARIAALSTAMVQVSPHGSGETSPHDADAPVQTRLAVGSVFDGATEGLRGRPAIKAAVVGAMAATITIGAIIGARMSDGSAVATNPRSAETAVANAPAPLELMAMRHQRQGTTLTVSGLVRNPVKSAAISGVTAVVFAFDRSGAFVASGRAPVDVAALSPGDESPFVVNVPNVSDVARYRVTFRSASGVVRHIDRRGAQVQLAHAVR